MDSWISFNLENNFEVSCVGKFVSTSKFPTHHTSNFFPPQVIYGNQSPRHTPPGHKLQLLVGAASPV